MSTTQRVAIITGASQGIGASLVTAYRKLGYVVVANSRTIGESDDPMVVTVSGDIGQPGVGQRVVDAAMERFGRVDTVVNNAGIFISKPFIDYTDEDYDAVTGVNLRGFFEVSRAAVAAMLSREGGGHIVNISTSLVDHANSGVPSALASLTKGGLNAVTKSLAIEYANRGIRANTVALGVIRTPIQGLRPYSVGRNGVAAYYDSQPPGMTVTYRVLETRRPTEELVLGYVRADFAFPNQPDLTLNLGVLVTHTDDGWRILHYQVSPVV
jgi:NAD(P)-dependent dehydrogenase (short-subunit alcohol dehydrogenase family)